MDTNSRCSLPVNVVLCGELEIHLRQTCWITIAPDLYYSSALLEQRTATFPIGSMG